jgi:hypothetical protein
MAAVAVLAGIPATAQAAPAEWTLHFDGLSGTPSPADAVSLWSGTCPVPDATYTVWVNGAALGGVEDRVRCESDGTYRFALLHYDYYKQTVRVEKDQEYKAVFLSSGGGGEATAVIE